ncbi:MAG: hypothetical protein N2327_02445 [Caldimicrobium sp.]|nr:hypothetical protein [Caldimicrobium sp.]MCX7873280.1 hypothetical protein [Caldimicrobium sp.]MDW8094736.1 hypothetical protein [Caldimicrobium sp.]
MSLRTFILKFLPLVFVLFFVKGVLSQVIALPLVDIYSALALSSVPLLNLNLWAFISLALLGILRSFDGYYPYFIFSTYYIGLLLAWHHSKRIFQQEWRYYRAFFWSLSLLLLLLLEVLIFFKRLLLFNLTYLFWFDLITESILYALVNLLFVYGLTLLLKRVLEVES